MRSPYKKFSPAANLFRPQYELTTELAAEFAEHLLSESETLPTPGRRVETTFRITDVNLRRLICASGSYAQPTNSDHENYMPLPSRLEQGRGFEFELALANARNAQAAHNFSHRS